MDNNNTNCCTQPNSNSTTSNCPVNGQQGKAVKLITLKSLLVPSQLAELDPNQDYYFCKDAECDVVYFSQAQRFTKQHLKVKVYQKETSQDVPVCYCFGWTPKQLSALDNANTVSASISEHIKAGRCGCEVNNPQGSCCLGNVTNEIKQLNKDGEHYEQ